VSAREEGVVDLPCLRFLNIIVIRMHVPRLYPRFVRIALALSLALSPVLSAMPGGMATAAPVVAAEHGTVAGGEHMHHPSTQPADGQQDQADSGCAQHDACLGQCCPGCAHCAGALMSLPVIASNPHPVLAPREPQFLPFALISLRERPPRTLSV
jgi:hypothetical protein